MHHILNLSSHEMSILCLLIAAVALFLAIILTIIHYATGVMSGFVLGIAAGAHAWWPMMQGWFRDVAIPLLISAGSLIVWGGLQLWERFVEVGVAEVAERF